MHFLLDHLAATVIGATVLLMVLFVQHRSRAALTDSTAFYAMIRQQEAFGLILARDLQSAAELVSVAETNGGFSFRGHIGDDPTSYMITYERERVRERDGLTYYRIKRLVDGQVDGGSGGSVTEWKIEGRDKFGQPVSDPAAAAQIYVRFEVRSLLGKQAKVKQSYWDASFFPPLLQ